MLLAVRSLTINPYFTTPPNHLPLRLLFACLLLGIATSLVNTQTDPRFVFPAGNGSLQNPAEFLGFEPGERFTPYAASVNYFRYLADGSPRIHLTEYGRSHEDRPLLLLTVSSEANLARREELQARHAALPDTYKLGAAEREAALDEPLVVSFSYSIHGNEGSTTEAAHQLAYVLATTDDPELLSALDQMVILMFVCINPDGRHRYVSWYNGVTRLTGGEEPDDLEHHAPWPNGRTNHYWFDLNRDWVWGVHPESRGHVAAYQSWMPQVHADYHEQGYNANYFTVPATTPRNLLLPEAYETWADTFGRANVAAFDPLGITYFTRERFDFYYPGYGSSYPNVHGAIGMLTEQGGIGAGRAVKTEDGYVLTLRQRIFDHYLTSLTTVRTAARHRRELLAYSLDAWNPLNAKSPATAYVIVDDGSEYLRDFVDVMLLNGVEMEVTNEVANLTTTAFTDGTSGEREIPRGSLIIPTEQARHLFVNSILGRNLAIEDSVMYDMSTWSAPLAYNLEAYTLEGAVRVDTRPLEENPFRTAGQLLDRTGGKNLYAAVVEVRQRNTPRALAEIWRAGLRVRATQETTRTLDGQFIEAGSLVILAGRNELSDAELRKKLAAIASSSSTEITLYATGRMADGLDLGSPQNEPLRQPRVALLVEPPFNTYTSGQLYYLFDHEIGLSVERIRVSKLAQTDLPKFGSRYGYANLDEYDVLLLPGGNRLGDIWKNKGLQQLTEWINRGGTVVALEQSALFFTKEGKVSSQLTRDRGRNNQPDLALVPFAEREDYRGKTRVPGSALRATIDQTHPLAFGLKPEVFTLKFGTKCLVPNESLETVGRYLPQPGELLVAGYADETNLATLAGNTWAGVQRLGKGKVVYILDNPHYRMFWRGPARLTINGVMWMPAF